MSRRSIALGAGFGGVFFSCILFIYALHDQNFAMILLALATLCASALCELWLFGRAVSEDELSSRYHWQGGLAEGSSRFEHKDAVVQTISSSRMFTAAKSVFALTSFSVAALSVAYSLHLQEENDRMAQTVMRLEETVDRIADTETVDRELARLVANIKEQEGRIAVVAKQIEFVRERYKLPPDVDESLEEALQMLKE